MAENERFMTGSLWIRSLREFKKLNVVAFCSMMCAVAMALNMVASITVGPYIRIGFSGLPNQVVAYLFGPAVGGIFGGALDVIKYILKPEGASAWPTTGRSVFSRVHDQRDPGRRDLRSASLQEESADWTRFRGAASGQGVCKHSSEHTVAQYALRQGLFGNSAGTAYFQRCNAADRHRDHVFHAAGGRQDDQKVF